jgi:LPXTG-motif cell wall-anchored protein
MAFQLPAAGDVQGQIQAGQNLVSMIETASGPGGDPSSLLEAGISLAASQLSPGGGQTVGGELLAIGGSALAGLAMAGPLGAAMAAFGTVIGQLSNDLKGANTATAIGVSEGTQTITAAIQNYGTAVGSGPNIGKPGGWSAADWSAFARPPSKTKNPAKLVSLCKQIYQYFLQYNGQSGSPCNMNVVGFYSMPCDNPSQWAGDQLSLCTPVWFYWYQPNSIAGCHEDIVFGGGGAGGSPAVLKQRWIQGTTAIAGQTQDQIVERAIPRLPDQLYWSAALYGIGGQSGISGFAAQYFNVDLINAMATVLTMLSHGASTQAIVSELLIQSYILSQQGHHDTAGMPLVGNVSFNQFGFHQLVDDYITLANQENAGYVAAPTAPAGPSTGDQIATVLGAAGLTLVAGVVGYSIYRKQSPIVTLQGIRSRIRSKRIV